MRRKDGHEVFFLPRYRGRLPACLALQFSLVNSDGRLRASILGNPFWETLDGLLTVISPVSKWIRIMEANTAGISIIPVAFEELETVFSANSLKQAPLDTADEKKMASKFRKRKRFILGKTKAANVAHAGCPVAHFLGRGFLDRQMNL